MKLIEVDALKEMLDKIPARRIENADGRAYVLIRLSTVFEIIKQLPSAQPERKRGFWWVIEKGEKGYSAGDFRCSVCGKPNASYTPTPNFCPNCGADMRGGEP